MPNAPTYEVRHDAAAQRFLVEVEGASAVLEYREIDATTLDYYRTFTPTALRGTGIASQITAHALRYAQERGLHVVPTCPFVATYIQRHPEFAALLR